MKRFNFSVLFILALAGILMGILVAHPAAGIALGLVAGCTLGFVVRPKKRSCCQ
jgi:hypothetical protein